MSHEKWLEYRVLIESDWNLKCRGKDAGENASLVLIESDWNLKGTLRRLGHLGTMVLIESDWNLKEPSDQRPPLRKCRINRIRLEFKVYTPF